MNSLYDEDEEETKARAATNCPACGIEKDKGLVVCWTCFKKPGGLKYSGLTLGVWLAAQAMIRTRAADVPAGHRADGR